MESSESVTKDIPSPVPTSPDTDIGSPTTATDSTDFDINFESVTSDSELLESLESTTSGSTTPFFLKTGRNIGTRIRGVNSNNFTGSVTVTGSNVNSVAFPPALRPRPTSSVISFNPTNYNRIVKRRKNSTLTNSTLLKGRNNSPEGFGTLSAETTEQSTSPPPTTTPTVSTSLTTLLQAQAARRKLLFGSRTTRPPPITLNDTTGSYPSSETETPSTTPEDRETTPPGPQPVTFSSSVRNRRVKITPLRLPLLIKPTPTVEPAAVSNVPVSSVYEEQSRAPFEYNPSYTVDDGIYRFKYSSQSQPQPQLSSRRVHSEEFGITRESYGDDGTDGDDEGGEDREDETTLRSPIESITRVPLHINIDGSEEEFSSSLPPAYRNYFSREEAPAQIVNPLQHRDDSPVRAVTITVTVTEKTSTTQTKAIISNPYPNPFDTFQTAQPTFQSHPEEHDLSQSSVNANREAVNHNNDHVINLLLAPTPALPIHHDQTLLSSSVVKVEQSAESKVIVNENQGGDSEPIVITSTHTVLLSHSPTIETGPKHEETNFHESGAHPDHKVLTTSNTPSLEISPTPTLVTSSKEFKSVFYTAETHPYFSSSSYSFSSSTEYSFYTPEAEDPHHHHDHEHESPAEDHSVKPQELHPSTSSIGYWDTLGLKTATVDFNTSSSEHLPSPSPSPPGDLVGGFSTPEADTEYPHGHSGILLYTSPTPSTSHTPNHDISTSSQESVSSVEIHSEEDNSSSNELHIPPVAVYIQILLDMPSTQFCPSVQAFKEMIILIYTDNKK